MILLCGDIGASNSRLAIVDTTSRRFLAKEFLKNSQFTNFHETLSTFCKKTNSQIVGACFGVAGPIVDRTVEITNLPWKFAADDIASFLKVEKCFLINDLVAIAHGIPELKHSDLKIISETKKISGTRAVIAPGSGIGEAILYWDGRKHHPMPTEGGHTSFSPNSALQIELLLHLRRELDHVSWERVLSGPGIFNIYQFLKETGKAPESPIVAEKIKSGNASAHITESAMKLKDPLCLKTVELFFEILATEAGNLALKTLPQGGLYIAGGIMPKLMNLFDKDAFLRHFSHKGRMSELLRSFSISLIVNEDVGIWGAARFYESQT